MRVLIVEDEAISRLALEIALEDAGHSVRGAGSCADALDAAEEFKPDLLLCDIGLPDGSGLQLICDLKEKTGIRVIALTGHDSDEVLAKLRSCGCDGWLIKPVDLDVVSRSIDAILSKPVHSDRPKI